MMYNASDVSSSSSSKESESEGSSEKSITKQLTSKEKRILITHLDADSDDSEAMKEK